jgi:hypothetical protein
LPSQSAARSDHRDEAAPEAISRAVARISLSLNPGYACLKERMTMAGERRHWRIPARIAAVIGFATLMASASHAADPGAIIVVKIYTEVCVPNMGKPDQVKAWAAEKHLPPITSEAALGVFVGAGEHGGAWAVPSNAGNFTLSIRGTTEACAVWARTADPADVEATFKKLIEGIARPGIEISKIQDKTVPTPIGQTRSLVYLVKTPASPTGFVFTMVTTEHPGSAFQASLQIAKGAVTRTQ